MYLKKENIEKKLEYLSMEAQVYFSLRCALRVLPYLSKEEKNFSYWEKEIKKRNLFFVFRALNFTIIKLIKNDSSFSTQAAFSAADDLFFAVDNRLVS